MNSHNEQASFAPEFLKSAHSGEGELFTWRR